MELKREVYGVSSLALELGISTATVRKRIDDGRLIVEQKNNRIVIRRESALSLIEAMERDRAELDAAKAKGKAARDAVNEAQRLKQKELRLAAFHSEDRVRVAGFIYIVDSPVGAYKIGKTVSLPLRLANFGIVLPFKTELIHAIRSSDITRAERLLHHAFANKRRRGEWFDLTEKDLDSLKQIGRIF